ncbi:MAG: glycosyltransferase family 2 protein [Gemmatimonadaceae bacterium]|nr:glycosyltransferase family 2 protein [Gemmatimonadaceae bacterium]
MTAQLACVVMSYRDEPFIADAVRSVLQQELPVEVVVVNSGGGDPAARLRAEEIDVPVHSVSERLYPGAARNVGIALTRAPYVAFLAADCMAAPGWAAARLREHRAGAAAVASAMTNAYTESAAAWAALLLLHNRRLGVTRPSQRLFYSLSYDRRLFDALGVFREDLRAGEDTEFNARIPATERVVFAVDALTAHRYPVTAGAMLRDAFRRGQLHAATQGSLENRGPQRLRVMLRAPWNVGRSVVLAARSTPPQRGHLVRALPYVVAGSVVYAAGALTTKGTEVRE